jgi:hypothetical protein
MKQALRSWQEKIYDAGLMPESEIVKRAKENKMTIYELVRNPDLYNLKAYLDMADIALEKNPERLPELETALKSPDSALRYWGTVGCLLLGKNAMPAQRQLVRLLEDSSDNVRGMAAWVLIKLNCNKEDAYNAFRKMFRSKSYAMLELLNIADWMGEDARPLIQDIQNIKSHTLNICKLQRTLCGNLGVPIPERLKKK